MANPFEQFDSEKEPVNPFAEFDSEAPPPPGPGPSNIPEQFKERVRKGEILSTEAGDAMGKPLKRLFGLGGEERYQLWPERMVRSALSAPLDALTGKLQVTDPETGMVTPEAIERAGDVANFALGSTMFSRVRGGMNGPVHEPIGTLPQDADFKAAAEALGKPEAEQNLRDLWEEKGIHPAEAVNDAQSDAFLKSTLNEEPGPREVNDKLLFRAGDDREGFGLYGKVEGNDFRVSTSMLPADLQGKGLGVDVYQKAIKWAADSGLKFKSDSAVSPEAERIYQSLERRGYDVKKADGVKVDADDGYLRTEDDSPVYTVSEPRSAAGADVTRPENLPSLEEQPLPQVGTITAAARDALDQLGGLARNIQGMLDPMATGSPRAMVIAKDAMNSVRRIQWDHVRIDNEITRRFDGEGRTRMWNAADEESVAVQLGESRENQGLVTLEPAERNMVELLHGEAQEAWLQAVDTGMVSGDGLPAYTPRMVLGVAAAGEHVSPRALNELGRNVFTRTSQMLHRKHMMAEETETAAKEMVRTKMVERGASPEEITAALENVKIARDIRALPLATARLKEAAVWKDMIAKIKEVGRAAGEDTVADFNPGGWFTIEGHPAFTEWKPDYAPNPVTGAIEARVDDAGNTIFRPKQLYMAPDFKGPMRAILDESSSPMKVVPLAPSLYEGIMAIKGKSMTAILNSPLIHNEVVWSKVAEAAGGRDWLGFGLYFKGNRIVNGHPARARELIDAGLNPIGPRGSYQDISGMMEEPNLVPGRSWTAKVLAAAPGLFDEGAEIAVRRAVDKMGDFWHNTLLWDRVRDVHFGLADQISDRLVAKGSDRLSADRIGSHLSNIIVGSIPKEAMSAGARAVANVFLFSRSFTLGNLSTFKAATLGLPKPILAQIERDFGMSAEAAVGPEATALASKLASGITRRKALSTIALSAGFYYVGNALLQNAFNIAYRDSSVDEEWQGYARRYADLMKDASSDPWELRHLIGRLSPTYDNEPRKQDRAHVGYASDGTALYARNPTGKFGEEMVGYPTMPLEMIKRKLSPGAGGMLEILENDKGFGRKIYDENDTSVRGLAATAFAVAKHLVMRHMPEGQINAAVDLLRGDGDADVNKLRVFGPAAGFTVSEGAPGGMAKGELYAEKAQKEAKFSIAWPDIKKQILRGDTEGARAAMSQIQLSPREQTQLIRAASNPARISGRALLNFIQSATPAQLERFNRARSNAPALAPQ